MRATLGDFLRALRLEHHLTIEELARRSGVAASTIGRWEHGEGQPQLSRLRPALAALNAVDRFDEAVERLTKPEAAQHLHTVAVDCSPTRPDLGVAMPAVGDLLRALRYRKGWTGTQLASHLGVSPSRITRWETSQELVPEDNLPRLLQALEALPMERDVLMARRLTLAAPWREEPFSLEQCIERFRMVLLRARSYQVFAGDLEFLTLEATLWPQAHPGTEAERLLAEVWIEHAGYLLGRRRIAAAGTFAQAALDTMNERRQLDGTWLKATHVCATHSAQRRSGSRRQAQRLLADQLPLALKLKMDSGVYREIAGYESQLGNHGAALTVLEQALRAAQRARDPIAQRLARFERAKVLLALGETAAADAALPANLPDDPILCLFEAQLRAQIAARCRSSADAAYWLRLIERHIDNHPDLECRRGESEEIARLLD